MKSTPDPLVPDDATLIARVRALGLYGLLANWSQVREQSWLTDLLGYEEGERKRRSLDRRLRYARIGCFKPMSDFDWTWPRKIDREAVDDAVNLGFVRDKANVVIIGPNGVAKTMIAKNVAHHALVRGHTVRFTNASDMLADLAAQDSSSALSRRLRRYCQPEVLCVDEVGYLSYDSRYADLFFEIVTRRYQAGRPILLTTNKAFEDWAQVFPNASCVVTLVDRLVHRCEQIEIDADSYRLKEAKERAAAKAKERASRRKKG
ncbi:MAG: ATP-binding protein [Gammaproteobacteria bacterium]|jgi:DNA replication protein DnaC|nr:ATP-binding protein [Gammaproteobacteria bacterium]